MAERGSPNAVLGRCRYVRAGGISCAPWRVAETVLVRPVPLNRSRVSVSVATAVGSLWSGFQVRATATVGRAVALRAAGRVITNCSVDTCENPTAMCRVSPGPELVEVKDAP